jgi:hypothetical protein
MSFNNNKNVHLMTHDGFFDLSHHTTTALIANRAGKSRTSLVRIGQLINYSAASNSAKLPDAMLDCP